MGESSLFEKQMPFLSHLNVLYERLDEYMFAFRDLKLTKYSLMTIIGGFILECNLINKNWTILYNITQGTPTLTEVQFDAEEDKLNFISLYGDNDDEISFPISSLLPSTVHPNMNV